jgi:hypothetical protein
MSLKFREHTTVKLRRDDISCVPQGSIGVIVDIPMGEVYMVEFFDEKNETIPESLNYEFTDNDLEPVNTV